MKNLLNIFLLIILSSLFSCENEKINKSTKSGLNLFGSVKTVSQNIVNYYHYSPSPSIENYSTFIRFNSLGMKIEETIYDIHKKKETTFFYRYDERNNLIEWIEYETDGSVKKTKRINYNSNNKIENSKLYDSKDNPYIKSEYNYSIFNDNLEIIQRYMDGTIFNKILKKYDENDNVIELTKWDKNSDVVGIISNEYDINDNIITKKIFTKKDLLEKIVRFEYNSNNDRIKKSYYNPNGEITINIQYEYTYLDSYKTWEENNWETKVVRTNGKIHNKYFRKLIFN